MSAEIDVSTNEEPTRALAQVLGEFARMMAEQQSVQAVLERVSDYTLSLLPVDGVGVLLRDDDGGLMVATANSEAGKIVEDLEAELGEGPCSKSMRTGRQIPVPDVAAAVDEFPRFVPRALEAGVRSIHAVPMTVKMEQVGSLNLIAMRPMQLSVEDLATAQLLTDVAISYIANSRLLGEQTLLAEQLQRALDTRVLLEQAKGTLAERHGISPEEAFQRLRAHARSERAKVHDIARKILTGELRI